MGLDALLLDSHILAGLHSLSRYVTHAVCSFQTILFIVLVTWTHLFSNRGQQTVSGKMSGRLTVSVGLENKHVAHAQPQASPEMYEHVTHHHNILRDVSVRDCVNGRK